MLRSIGISLLIVSFLFTGCEKDEDLSPYSYQNESTIYSGGSTIQFREILLTIKLFVNTPDGKKYVVTDSLLNVTIKMNEVVWGVMNSLSIDTSAIVKELNNSYFLTEFPVKYNILARYQPSKPVLTTAGEYADMLRSFLILEPGFYFCRIISFQFRMPDGKMKTVVPLISETIEITKDTRSLFLGEFEVEIR